MSSDSERRNSEPQPAHSPGGERTGSAVDSVGVFARDMRTLRHKRGEPTLTSMESKTGISKSTFSSAFRGTRLPSEKTVRAIMKALGVDPRPWIERRIRLADCSRACVGVQTGRLRIPPEPTDGSGASFEIPSITNDLVPAEAETAASHPGPTLWPKLGWAFVSGVAVLAVAATSIASIGAEPSVSEELVPAASSVREFVEFSDGIDPLQTSCRDDAVVAASAERLGGDFVVEMMYSELCRAVWGKVTRYDDEAVGNRLSMTVYYADEVDGPRTQQQSSLNLQSLYSTMLIRDSSESEVCGLAAATQDVGQDETLEPALCF